MKADDVLLITGGSRGIGAATARLAAAAGYRVAINYREREDAAAELVREIEDNGGHALAIRADVSDEADIERLFAELDEAFGRVDALVNSAGIGGNQDAVANFDAAVLARLFRVNVIGAMLCCREAVRRMSTAAGGRGGAIVNVSSMAATIGGRAGSSDYAASKAALDCFTVGLAREVGTEGIRVNALRPGMTATDMIDEVVNDPARLEEISASIAMRRVATADEIARPILWLLSDAASFVSGACIDASGGGFVIGKPLAPTDQEK